MTTDLQLAGGPAVLRKAAWRLLPFLCLLYIFNILNRGNLGFARGVTSMKSDLDLTDAVMDVAYGLFYFGYLLFQIPANLLLRRIGARRWIALLMVLWGVVSAATMTVTGVEELYLVRVLLGIAQAGFFPGIIFYLTFWFPDREHARVIALFMVAIPFSGVVGNPLHGAIVDFLDGEGGLKGWQWLFLLEGMPTVLLGVAVFFYLPDGPDQAGWLTAEEGTWLSEQLREVEQRRRQRRGAEVFRAMLDVLSDGRVWLLIGVYFTVAVGANAGGAHIPRLIREHFADWRKSEIGLLAALPPLCAMIGMTLWGTHSDRTGERRAHVAIAAFVAAGGWLLAAAADSPWLALAGLCLAEMGMMSMLPTFWAIPTSFLSGTAAAGGIALVNSVANIGGVFGPRILGYFGLKAMALILFLGGVLVLTFRQGPPPAPAEPEQ
jgi:ACS family tartrate transporter-like MFS transporter